MTALAADSFNRANANPIGSPWTTASGISAMQIVSNACTPTTLAGDCGAFYSTLVWPNDQYSKAKLSVTGTSGGTAGARLFVRHASAADTCYILVVDHAATLNVALQKVVASAFTTFSGFPVTQAWTNGDTWEIRVVGTLIGAFLNGKQIGATITDSIIADGFPGIGYSSTSTAVTIDDWEGGDFSHGSGQRMAPQQRMT